MSVSTWLFLVALVLWAVIWVSHLRNKNGRVTFEIEDALMLLAIAIYLK